MQKISRLLHRRFEETGKETGKILFPILIRNEKFKILNTWTKAFDNEWAKESVDPIQLFASFSGSRSLPSTRTRRINALISILAPEEKTLVEIDYTGCPTPPPIRLQAVREYKNQEQIWEVFAKIYKEGGKGLSETDWTKVPGWYGVAHPSFTVFLFWVRSDQFLPLDANTLAFLKKYQIPEKTTFQFR